MLVDTHCHLDFDRYDRDRAEVIARAAAAGVTRIINPAVDLRTGQAAIRLADTYPGVFAAVGVHPNDSATYAEAMIAALEAQARHPKVVAVGEIGLDYYREFSLKTQQFAAFEAQLDLAARLGLPVIIHNRDASMDVVPILEAWAKTLPDDLKTRPGVLHSFSAPSDAAERVLAAGFYLGFTGPITYKKADDLRAVARMVPLDRLLVETDGPFLTPQAYRGQRNEPAYVRYMAEALAALHGLPDAQVEDITTGNAERLFRLPATP
ncbi:MAG TPA: TatD family hydrolase [Aggregatilineales bacterium]|nr:TatD family hydrolase [Aggregatilineales bacterium]